ENDVLLDGAGDASDHGPVVPCAAEHDADRRLRDHVVRDATAAAHEDPGRRAARHDVPPDRPILLDAARIRIDVHAVRGEVVPVPEPEVVDQAFLDDHADVEAREHAVFEQVRELGPTYGDVRAALEIDPRTHVVDAAVLDQQVVDRSGHLARVD